MPTVAMRPVRRTANAGARRGTHTINECAHPAPRPHQRSTPPVPPGFLRPQRCARPWSPIPPTPSGGVRSGASASDDSSISRAAARAASGHAAAAPPISPEVAAVHSITSSARARRNDGSVNPMSRAALALTISSNLVGCSTGMSAGFAPLRILLAERASARNESRKCGP
jgi:hypothetical protein